MAKSSATKLSPIAQEYKAHLHDPLMLRTTMLVQNSGKAVSFITQHSGVTHTTLRNWTLRKTRRPQAATLRAVLKVLGYELTIKRF